MTSSVNINVADIRAEPKFQSERISQALFNEVVEVNDEKDGYLKVRCGDGYEGWMASQFVSEHSDFPVDISFIVDTNLACGYAKPDINSKRIVCLPYGCCLYGKEENGFLNLSTDRYGNIFVKISDTRKFEESAKPLRPDREELIAETEKFLSAPYLWGGRSFFGIDCSGFVQTIARRFGVELPRDTRDQINVGVEAARDKIQYGDLMFFPRHVVLAVSETDFIHSSSTNGGVAFNSLDPQSAIFSEYYHLEFKTARRIFE